MEYVGVVFLDEMHEISVKFEMYHFVGHFIVMSDVIIYVDGMRNGPSECRDPYSGKRFWVQLSASSRVRTRSQAKHNQLQL